MRHQQTQSTRSDPQMNLYTTAVNLPEETRIEVIQTLNQALADTTDLQSQAKFAHWNVKGYDFYQLHLLFDEIAEVLSEHVDTIAERITALGGQAMGTTRIAAGTSRLPEPPANAVEEEAYLEWLTDHVAHHANGLRTQIDRAAELGDEDTADLFTELSREVDEQLYFLESHLQSDVETQVPATASQATGSTAGGSGAQGPQSGTKIEIQPDGNRAFGASRSVAQQSSRGTNQQLGAQQSVSPDMGMPRDAGQPPSVPEGIPQSASQPTGPPPETGQSFGEQPTPQEPGQHGFQQRGRRPRSGPQAFAEPVDAPQSDVHGGAPAHEAATSTLHEPPGGMGW